MDQDSKPDWIEKLKVNPMVVQERWSLYDPMLGFSGNFESNIYTATCLSDNSRVNKHAQVYQKELRLDPALFRNLGEVLKRIKASDGGPSIDLPFKDLYVILRSDIMLVDLNEAEHGERSQEVLYAYLFGVPVIGVSHRFILSPWMAGKMNAVVFPATTDEIVAQVLAYDHKITAALKYFRAADKELKEIESKKGVLEAARELRENVQGAVDDIRKKKDEEEEEVKEPKEDGRHTGASNI
jgi:hypothetical protein